MKIPTEEERKLRIFLRDFPQKSFEKITNEEKKEKKKKKKASSRGKWMEQRSPLSRHSLAPVRSRNVLLPWP